MISTLFVIVFISLLTIGMSMVGNKTAIKQEILKCKN